MAGSGTASSSVHLAGSGTSSLASASCEIHAAHARAHTGAASPSPYSPVCNASNPVHLSHARASVSPNTRELDSPWQILQQMHLGGCVLTSALTWECWIGMASWRQPPL